MRRIKAKKIRKIGLVFKATPAEYRRAKKAQSRKGSPVYAAKINVPRKCSAFGSYSDYKKSFKHKKES